MKNQQGESSKCERGRTGEDGGGGTGCLLHCVNDGKDSPSPSCVRDICLRLSSLPLSLNSRRREQFLSPPRTVARHILRSSIIQSAPWRAGAVLQHLLAASTSCNRDQFSFPSKYIALFAEKARQIRFLFLEESGEFVQCTPTTLHIWPLTRVA